MEGGVEGSRGKEGVVEGGREGRRDGGKSEGGRKERWWKEGGWERGKEGEEGIEER